MLTSSAEAVRSFGVPLPAAMPPPGARGRSPDRHRQDKLGVGESFVDDAKRPGVLRLPSCPALSLGQRQQAQQFPYSNPLIPGKMTERVAMVNALLGL